MDRPESVEAAESPQRRALRLPSPAPPPAATAIELRGVETNNLRGIDIDVPHRELTVITGVSGSGKSSLAFDTLYAEGQRRFLESMSTYARQFLQRMEKPPLRAIRNVLPAIALRQKGASAHSRSTIGTVTELDDHLQMLYAHIGEQRCPECGDVVDRDSVGRIMERLEALGEGTRLVFVSHVRPSDEEHNQHVLARLVEQGWRRFWVDDRPQTIEELDIERLLAAASFPILIDRLVVSAEARPRLIEAIETGMDLGGGALEVHVQQKGADTFELVRFHRAFRCNGCGADWVEPQPALFNPNTTLGACPTCTGFGRTMGLDVRKVVPNPYRSLQEGAVVIFETPGKRRERKAMFDFARAAGIPLNKPWRELSDAQREGLVEGRGRHKGIRGFFDKLEKKRTKVTARIFLARYRGYAECGDCGGARLSRQARHVFVGGAPLQNIYKMTTRDALAHFEGLELDDAQWAAIEVLYDEVVLRLRYMDTVGLGYLCLDRQTRTLSGGEFQRLQLTSSIGRALTDTLYVLDEPTAGLHARDSERLLQALYGLRDLGNTVVVVEHDPEIIEGADHCIEIGPHGGEGGGHVMFAGDVAGLRVSQTATGRMLSGRVERSPRTRRPVVPGGESIRIVGATEHNLANLDVTIPLRCLVCVTGVSGSGKSTLVGSVLYNGWRARQGDGTVTAGAVDRIEGFGHVDHIVLMNQRAMGRSSRSNPATYTKAWDAIRRLLAGTRSAKERGITTKHFSFNSRGGRCEVCEGTGSITVEMQFMADVELQCESCEGKRFTEPVLAVEYRGKNIADVLAMTVSEAMAFFREQRSVTAKLQPLLDVGLGYLRLGQTTATLSGGELQRLKLAGHLQDAARQRKKSGDDAEHDLFIFDEPTVGLHLQDVEVLVAAIEQLVEAGHSVLVVEHNTDFIAAADHVIDLGPGGGDAGGRLVVAGTPEAVAACGESETGRFLAALTPGPSP